jgi:amino acid transporter
VNRQVHRKELLLKSYINLSETERKVFREISPKKNINATISILVIILIVSVLSLFSARQLLHIQDHVLYVLLLLIFLLVGWRMSLLKVIMLQTSKN